VASPAKVFAAISFQWEMTAGSSAAAVAPVAAEAVPVARVARRTAAVKAAS